MMTVTTSIGIARRGSLRSSPPTGCQAAFGREEARRGVGTMSSMGVATRSTAPSPIVLVPRLAKQIMRRSSDELLGINFRLLVALSYLHDHDGAPQQELGDALSMDAGNVVLLLNELEDFGYVSRSRDPDDRRRHRVAITSAGREAIDRARRAQDELEDDLLRALTTRERATLARLLARAVQGVDDAYRQSAADQLAD
jgi:DNA-binding MarR family transcriptional regulator